MIIPSLGYFSVVTGITAFFIFSQILLLRDDFNVVVNIQDQQEFNFALISVTSLSTGLFLMKSISQTELKMIIFIAMGYVFLTLYTIAKLFLYS